MIDPEGKIPIYDQLLSKVLYNNSQPNNNKLPDWDRIRSAINQLTDDSYLEVLYALILHHYLLEHARTETGNSSKQQSDKQQSDKQQQQFMANNRFIPYYGRTPDPTGRGILYTVTNLPPLLQQIIAAYLQAIVTF